MYLTSICLSAFIFIIQSIVTIEGQFGIRGQQSPLDRIPGFGVCDRIASRGVTNCMENFLPQNVLSGIRGGQRGTSGGGICCSYSKYKACINGLNAGLRIAMEREKCPRSYSTRIIRSYGDSFVGLPLKTMCSSDNRRSKCPPTAANTKPKRSKKTTKRPQNKREEENSDPISSAFQPIGDIFNPRGGSSRNGDNPLGSIGDVFNPRGGSSQNGGNPLGSIGDVFNPRGSSRNTDNNPLGPIGDVFNRGRETFEQGASSLLGGVQNIFGGLSGNRGGGGRNRGEDFN